MRKNIKISKILVGVLIIILSSLGFINSVYASNITSANIYKAGDCGRLLTYKGVEVIVSYVEYVQNGVHYPAYCLDKTKIGAEAGSYTVSIQDIIKDVGLWRRIINGYPYKTPAELGVANKEEAFTATKQAVYCYIHGNNPADYGAIGEAGKRTLNAMYKIIKDAENSTETKISSTIDINKNETWKQDNIDKNYISKTYSISSKAQLENYKITLSREKEKDLGGIKLTDEKNQEKSEFKAGEKFKVLVPAKNMTEKGDFNLSVEAKLKTKPVLYGEAPNSNNQDYAVTTAVFEDGTGNVKDSYNKNETKIIIIKKDNETKKYLSGVEFELLDKNKNVVYTNLKTDSNGKVVINTLVPGEYYLREIKALDGYIKSEELVKIDVELNQEMTVTINNNKEKQPEVEKTTGSKEVKKLPVTGM